MSNLIWARPGSTWASAAIARKRAQRGNIRSTIVRLPGRLSMRGMQIPAARLPFQQPRILGRPSNQEVKSFDQVVAFGAVALGLPVAVVSAEPAVAFSGMTHINCIPQGPTVANRIGNKVVIKSIHFRACFTGVATASAVVGFRYLIVYDRQPNGAFPALGDVILDQPGGAGTAMSSINIANKNRFQFIRDKFMSVDPGAGQEIIVNEHMKGRWEVEFGANTGSIGDFRMGSVLLIAFAVNITAGGVWMSAIQSRCRYFD